MSDTTETYTEVAPPSLTIVDIERALQIIDHAADQGAFKGWGTIESVLLVRTRLADFVTYAKANQPEAPAEETPAE